MASTVPRLAMFAASLTGTAVTVRLLGTSLANSVSATSACASVSETVPPVAVMLLILGR